MNLTKKIMILFMASMMNLNLSASTTQYEMPMPQENGDVILVQVKEAIDNASKFFTVRGQLKKIRRSFQKFDTSLPIVLGVVGGLLVTSVVTQTGQQCWISLGQGLIAAAHSLSEQGAWLPTLAMSLIVGSIVFLVANQYSAKSYCWAGMNLLEAVIEQLKTDDFYTKPIASTMVRSYVLMNFNSVVDAVNRYRAIASTVNLAQEFITAGLETKNEEIAKQCRLFLTLIRKVEQLLEFKLQLLYQEMGEDYQKQLEQQRKDQQQEKLERKIDKAAAQGNFKYQIREDVAVG